MTDRELLTALVNFWLDNRDAILLAETEGIDSVDGYFQQVIGYVGLTVDEAQGVNV